LFGTDEGNKILHDFDNNESVKNTWAMVKSSREFFAFCACILGGTDIEYRLILYGIIAITLTTVWAIITCW